MAQVLIVDDDAILRAFAVELLTQAGHACAEAADGELAIQWLSGNHADVVVTDMFMPNKDGLEVLRDVRSRWPSTKVIGISAGWNQITSDDILRIAGVMGADAITDKPLGGHQVRRPGGRGASPLARRAAPPPSLRSPPLTATRPSPPLRGREKR